TASGIEIEFWACSPSGPVKILIAGQEAVCFVEQKANVDGGEFGITRIGDVDLKTFAGVPVKALYFRSQRDLFTARRRLRESGVVLYESDIKPADRYLMERFITGPCTVSGPATQHAGYMEYTNPRMVASNYRPTFNIASIDIETEGLDGALYSVAVATRESERVFMVGAGQDTETIQSCTTEKALLTAFCDHLRHLDPDMIIGWNVIDFDLRFLDNVCRRDRLAFAIGRDNASAVIPPSSERTRNTIPDVPGRVVLDGITALRSAMYRFEDFSLQAVSGEVLGRGKLIHKTDRVEEITRLYHEAPEELAAYNLEDCRLVLDIFDALNLVDFHVERASMTGLPMGRPGGSVAAFDYLYLPRLHRHGFVAPDPNPDRDVQANPGGFVMESVPGLHENVLVLDFKSLYPSIIRTFHIDPLAMAVPGEDAIPGFEGASFSRESAILPEIIEELWQARDKAKKDNNKPLSQAIKILMNSFYGVLGTPGCRFYSNGLASSITRRGQKIIKQSREIIEQEGRQVIYGDTDSLIILLGPGYTPDAAVSAGKELAVTLNAWWRAHLRDELNLDSRLEIQFEKLFLRFFMPSIRGSETGSKKRYAGLAHGAAGAPTVKFTGMECVRSDWTPLARDFQRELYRRVFLDMPYIDYVRQTANYLMAGKLDDQLVYRKQLRKPLEEYTKNVPPHVQAARKLDKPGRWIRYVITTGGPEPAELRTFPLDYTHYLDRQLAPAADALLHHLGTSVHDIIDPQMSLFR
ncbi:MAG: DNA polymerase II, partial [Candidatus Hydrogenedentes bacterium]|nr:DNA polymerase II [Candidatus Hydrogenedentota bacterium]